MDVWAERLLEVMKRNNVDIWMIAKYVDDVSVRVSGELQEVVAEVPQVVDDFIALAQEYNTKNKKRPSALANSRRVRRILLHAIDDVFRPLDQADSQF